MALVKLNDISTYFKLVDNRWIFIGKTLEILVPEIYRDRGLLILGDIADCLAIFQLRINDKYYANMMMLGKVLIEYASVSNEIVDGYPYFVLTVLENGTFIKQSNIVKDPNVAYDIFVTFIALGKIPNFISYSDIASLFDNDKKCCDINLGVNRSIFEMIYAHMFRDKQDPYTFYRNTQMTKPPVIVPIHQISHGPVSSSAKIIGSYMSEGMISSIVDESEKKPSVVENLLRG
jgi:hypothetical protein